jgi:hypothetical protein
VRNSAKIVRRKTRRPVAFRKSSMAILDCGDCTRLYAGNRVIEESEKLWCPYVCMELIQGHTRTEVESTILRSESDVAGAWLERQKSYRKILRTASVSSCLLFVLLIVVRLFAKDPLRKPSLPVAGLLAVFLSAAFYYEEKHFYGRHVKISKPPALGKIPIISRGDRDGGLARPTKVRLVLILAADFKRPSPLVTRGSWRRRSNRTDDLRSDTA